VAGGPGFEPRLTESESACFTVELSPARWQAKFGRMDVSEARRGQGLEIDHKEIARRNTLALVTPTERADYHLATPLLAPPGEVLGESIDLIVVATGKREQLSDELFQPSGAPGKTDRSSGKQIGLGNQSSALVGVGLRGRDVGSRD
jgi:hypothetical protein